jgi:hypothetical protein
MNNIINLKWKDLQVGDSFIDNSNIIQIHASHEEKCFELIYGHIFNNKTLIASGDHLLLCNIKKLTKEYRDFILNTYSNIFIPIEEEAHIYTEENLSENDKSKVIEYFTKGKYKDDPNLKSLKVKNIITKKEPSIVNNNIVWLPISVIHRLLSLGQSLYCNGFKLKQSYYVGIKEVRCVSTDTGKYKVKGLVHHNSVTLRNIIFHAITHNNDVAVALVDLKRTEFTGFKGLNGVVGVANTVLETAELLRMCREVMKNRNKFMADRGLVDINDYKPSHPSNKIWLSGKTIDENTQLQVKINGEEKTMTANELLKLVNQ